MGFVSKDNFFSSSLSFNGRPKVESFQRDLRQGNPRRALHLPEGRKQKMMLVLHAMWKKPRGFHKNKNLPLLLILLIPPFTQMKEVFPFSPKDKHHDGIFFGQLQITTVHGAISDLPTAITIIFSSCTWIPNKSVKKKKKMKILKESNETQRGGFWFYYILLRKSQNQNRGAIRSCLRLCLQQNGMVLRSCRGAAGQGSIEAMIFSRIWTTCFALYG